MTKAEKLAAKLAREAAKGDSSTPPAAPEVPAPLVIELKAKRQVTRYTVAYAGITYESPRKALDAAGLAGYKGSQVRAVLAGKPVGTVIRIEGKEFTYTGAPAK